MPVLLTGCGFIMKLIYLLGLGAYECDIMHEWALIVLFNNEYISVNEIKSSVADLTDRVKSLEQLDSPALSSKSSIKCPKELSVCSIIMLVAGNVIIITIL